LILLLGYLSFVTVVLLLSADFEGVFWFLPPNTILIGDNRDNNRSDEGDCGDEGVGRGPWRP